MNGRQVSTLAQAIALLDEWIAANKKLQAKYDDLLEGYNTRGELLEHLDKLIRALQRDEEIPA